LDAFFAAGFQCGVVAHLQGEPVPSSRPPLQKDAKMLGVYGGKLTAHLVNQIRNRHDAALEGLQVLIGC